MIEDCSSPLFTPAKLTELALLIDDVMWERAATPKVHELIDLVRTVVKEEQALDLRVARTLAWLRHQDLAPIGFSSWTAFLEEHGGWGLSWTRQLVRFVDDPKPRIKEAVASGRLPLTTAVKSAGKVVEDEEEWIERALAGNLPPPERWQAPVVSLTVVTGEDAETVKEARSRLRTLHGWRMSDNRADDLILRYYKLKTPAEEILSMARETPPTPARLTETSPEWDDGLTTLGPWVPPTDVSEGFRRLKDLQNLKEGRTTVLGLAYQLIKSCYLWNETPCETLAEFCTSHLGKDIRTFQRYANLGMELFLYPETFEATKAGLSLDRAELVMKLCGDNRVEELLELARRVGMIELNRAVDAGVDVLDAYEPLLQEGGLQEGGLQEGGATETGGHIALRDLPDPDRTELVYVPRNLVVAARWFLETVPLPAEHGIRKTAKRDRYTCQNPLCRRRTLRVQVHHIQEQGKGGSDDPDNLITLCPHCHLRGVHSKNLEVTRSGDFLTWRWPQQPAVRMWAPVARVAAHPNRLGNTVA